MKITETRFFLSLTVLLLILAGYVISSAYTDGKAKSEWCKNKGGIYFATRDGDICIKKDAVIVEEEK